MKMWLYIFKRLLLMIPTLLGVLLLTFVVVQFVPGGPVEQMVAQLQGRDAGGEASAAVGAGYRGRQGVDAARIQEIKALYGFDKPASERFWQMLQQFVRFDLGQSFYQPKSVWELVKEKLPVSISLGLWTFVLSYLISVPLGIAKAVRSGTRFDTLSSLVVLVGYAIPGFVLGVALLVIFGGQLQWFPLRGLTSSNWDELAWGARVVDYLWHITLPITASVLGAFAVTTMLTKNAFLEEIRKQYVITARAKGLDERIVVNKHARRNARIEPDERRDLVHRGIGVAEQFLQTRQHARRGRQMDDGRPGARVARRRTSRRIRLGLRRGPRRRALCADEPNRRARHQGRQDLETGEGRQLSGSLVPHFDGSEGLGSIRVSTKSKPTTTSTSTPQNSALPFEPPSVSAKGLPFRASSVPSVAWSLGAEKI